MAPLHKEEHPETTPQVSPFIIGYKRQMHEILNAKHMNDKESYQYMLILHVSRCHQVETLVADISWSSKQEGEKHHVQFLNPQSTLRIEVLTEFLHWD